MTAGNVVRAFDPDQGTVGYETGSWSTGCYYDKCHNGYAYLISNGFCKQGHYAKSIVPSGYPVCPHGYHTDMVWSKAHCYNDSGWDTSGYRAPCGRTTTKTDPVYGYVTRTYT